LRTLVSRICSSSIAAAAAAAVRRMVNRGNSYSSRLAGGAQHLLKQDCSHNSHKGRRGGV
jgi:hypothetical protein